MLYLKIWKLSAAALEVNIENLRGLKGY